MLEIGTLLRSGLYDFINDFHSRRRVVLSEFMKYNSIVLEIESQTSSKSIILRGSIN